MKWAKVFADAEAVYTYEGTYEINALLADLGASCDRVDPGAREDLRVTDPGPHQ